jgi:hypothetical protein
MPKSILHIVESAYRGVVEEQDDTILWLLAAMQVAGAEQRVLLRGNAVNYAVAGQGAPALSIGGWNQTGAPKLDRDVAALINERGIPVLVVREDVRERGIADHELIAGITLVPRASLAKLCDEHEIVSLW